MVSFYQSVLDYQAVFIEPVSGGFSETHAI
jgi:hypothetical protein